MMAPAVVIFLDGGVQAGGMAGICERHILWQGEPQLGVQGCGGRALVQQQPGLVAVKVVIRLDSARASALCRRLSASR
jgi:hypothetical protein